MAEEPYLYEEARVDPHQILKPWAVEEFALPGIQLFPSVLVVVHGVPVAVDGLECSSQ